MFRNLHIFIDVQQICHLENAKRKINIPIFTIWNCHGPSLSGSFQEKSSAEKHEKIGEPRKNCNASIFGIVRSQILCRITY